MADNTTLNTGTGGDTIATDDIAGVKYQRVKITLGADGAADNDVDAGQQLSAASVPVVIASDQSAVAVDGSGVTQPVSHAALTELAAAINASSQLDVNIAASAATVAVSNAGITTIAGAVSGTEMQVDVVAALPAGTNNIGDVDIASIAAGDNNIGNVDVVTLPGSAHDAAISGNPVRVAGRAATADYTAVTAGDTADLLASTLGKLVVMPYALPGASWSYASPAAVTDTNDDAAKAAVASTRHYITGVQVFNGHDTVGTEVVIKDGATVLWRGWAEQTGGGCSAHFDPPLRGTANTAVNVANITTGSSTYFNLQGFSGTE